MLSEHAEGMDTDYLAFISMSALHLLQTYIQEAYPKHLKPGKRSKDSAELAQVVYHAQTMLRRILSSSKWKVPLPTPDLGERKEMSMMELVLESCCSVFRSCFHAFYPTTPLKWWALCQHLQLLDPVSLSSEEVDFCSLTTWFLDSLFKLAGFISELVSL